MRSRDRRRWCFGLSVLISLFAAPLTRAAEAPAWLHALVSAPLPAHDEQTAAVELLSETIVTVHASGDITKLERRAFRILRPEGRARGALRFDYDTERAKLTSLYGWSIPAKGKDYVVTEGAAVETFLSGIANGQLMSNMRSKVLTIPATDPGSVIGFEVERTLSPYNIIDEWEFQDALPVVEARYTLSLPAGWSYKATWINHAEVAAAEAGRGQWRWVVKDLKAIRPEGSMPPPGALAGRLVLSLIPPAGRGTALQSWSDVGTWYLDLSRSRRDPTADIRQKVMELTTPESTTLAKMQALAKFVQEDIRYVAIELGIGGYQPHAAADVYAHRYGDCKDKVTLLSSMLKEIGIDSHYVLINTYRGVVDASTPPTIAFNHAILAIQAPAGVDEAQLPALVVHPTLGKVLYFDPTDSLTPLGQLRGALQANYGVLVAPGGGELVQLPRMPAAANAIDRTALFKIDDNGALHGDVHEVRRGDQALAQRSVLRSVAQDSDRIRTVESELAGSFTSFEITKASIRNLRITDRPLEWQYSLVSDSYAKSVAELLLVRPRVLGSKSSALLEKKEPRENPIVFNALRRDSDLFEIELPPGYEVDNLPPPVTSDIGIAFYQSKTELVGRVLRYTRTFEIRELYLPADKADVLKQFYRTIENDERMVAVLKRVTR